MNMAGAVDFSAANAKSSAQLRVKGETGTTNSQTHTHTHTHTHTLSLSFPLSHTIMNSKLVIASILKQCFYSIFFSWNFLDVE